MSLRIVFVAPFGLKHKTTVWARTLPIAQSLMAAGHQATILVPPWDSPEDAGQVQTVGGVRIEQISLTGGLLGSVKRLLTRITELKPDIVHIEKPRAHAGLVQWWLWYQAFWQNHPTEEKPSFKIVLDVDDWEQSWNSVNRYPWHVGHFLTWQEEWGIRHAHGITTASRWLQDKVNHVAPQIPTLYLPNGVTPLTEPLQPSHDTTNQPPQILFFTRLVEVSPEWLKAFWQSVLAENPTAQLIIAGTPVQPWLAKPFQNALAPLPQITWTGYIPSPELPVLYAKATVAIFPALPVPLQQAKCSVRLATTLLHGVPVVASAVGEQSYYGAEGAATLVPADATPEQFAKTTTQLIRNPKHNASSRTDRVEATNRLVTRYAWSRLTAPLPAFYSDLLGQES